jgi:hypothetical protein
MVLEPIQVLVPLAAHLTLIWFLFFHAKRSRVRGSSFRVDNRERAVSVIM